MNAKTIIDNRFLKEVRRTHVERTFLASLSFSCQFEGENWITGVLDVPKQLLALRHSRRADDITETLDLLDSHALCVAMALSSISRTSSRCLG